MPGCVDDTCGCCVVEVWPVCLAIFCAELLAFE